MRFFFLLTSLISLLIVSCTTRETHLDNMSLATLFNKYYDERMQLLPIESTLNGDSLNNDKLYAYFTDS